MKSKKSAENTFCCLSPEELLQTAEEILTEVRKSVCCSQKCDFVLTSLFHVDYSFFITFKFGNSIIAL